MTDAPLHWRTPLLKSRPLSASLGSPVYLKMEAWQPTGSFKIRGIGLCAYRAMLKGAERLVASSGGNAGLAVAYAGRHLNLPVSVVVPESTPVATQDKLRREGADVTVHGIDWDDAHDMAAEIAAADAATAYIHPFDDPDIWEGHATMIKEVQQQLEEEPQGPGFFDSVIVAVGGGGLLCGVMAGLQKARYKGIPTIAVETEGADSFAQSVKAGAPVTLPTISSVAKSLGARRVCDEALRWYERGSIESAVVSDDDAISACCSFLDDHRTLVEPACGAALSLAYTRQDLVEPAGNTLIIVCGGAGVDTQLLNTWQRKTAE